MTHDAILRRLRFALDLSDTALATMVASGGATVDVADVPDLLGGADVLGTCTELELAAFLDGLILERRGPSPGGARPPLDGTLSHNEVLKKLRVAFEMKEADVLATLDKGGHTMSKGELSALYRKPGHKHYRECGDQVIRKFLRGLTYTLRPGVEPTED